MHATTLLHFFNLAAYSRNFLFASLTGILQRGKNEQFKVGILKFRKGSNLGVICNFNFFFEICTTFQLTPFKAEPRWLGPVRWLAWP